MLYVDVYPTGDKCHNVSALFVVINSESVGQFFVETPCVRIIFIISCTYQSLPAHLAPFQTKLYLDIRQLFRCLSCMQLIWCRDRYFSLRYQYQSSVRVVLAHLRGLEGPSWGPRLVKHNVGTASWRTAPIATSAKNSRRHRRVSPMDALSENRPQLCLRRD